MMGKKRTKHIIETAKKKEGKGRKEKKIKCFLCNKGYVVTTHMTVF